MADENQEVQYTETEQRAMEQGWTPEEEFKSNPANEGKKWRTAEDFLDRGELFAKIDELARKNKNTQKTLDQLAAHHKKVREVEYQRALNTLKAQKKEALEDGDADLLIEIDDKIAEVKLAQKEESRSTQATGVPEELEAWIGKNPWYNSDKEMAADADSIGIGYKMKNPDKSPDEVLVYVERQIKRMYPEKFTNPNRPKAGVEAPSNRGASKSSGGFTLSEDEERVARNFERNGIMSRADYIKELKGKFESTKG
jgi:hypothetical protein